MSSPVAASGPLGILSGGGGLPGEIAAAVRATGRDVHIVAIEGEADPAVVEAFPHTWVNWGGIGAMLSALERNRCREMIIVGAVNRPNLGRLRPDLGFFRSLPKLVKLLRGGDDAVLRRVVRFFEASGMTVQGVHDIAPQLLAGTGAHGPHQATPEDLANITRGIDALARLGRFDLGQAAVVADGRLIELEGADGTDAMLRRLKADFPLGIGRRAVLVKLPKPTQEMRVDLPTIGPRTIALAAEAGLSGIAVAAGATLIAERAQALAAGDAAGLFIHGVVVPQASDMPRPRGATELRAMGAVAPSPLARADAQFATDLLTVLDDMRGPCVAVVSRRYVLAVEAAERPARAVERGRRSKPWGLRQLRARTGVLAASGANPALTAAVVGQAAQTGLAGVVLTGPRPALPALLKLTEAANKDKIALLRAVPAEGDAAGGNRALRVFMVAGEHSGDALGAGLMRSLQARTAGRIHFDGLGGEAMTDAGLDSIFPMSDVAVMGPVAIAQRLPGIVRRAYETIGAGLAADPDIVVIIDSPEFTHPIAKRIRRRRPDIPIVGYVSPTVWAWRPGRARKMRPYVDRLMALLPFEPAAHERLGGPPCTYVGHPFVERLPDIAALDADDLARRLGLVPGKPVLVVLPGSRGSEVAKLLQPFGEAVDRLAETVDGLQVLLPAVPHLKETIAAGVKRWATPVHIVEGEADKFRAFKLATAALAASGTVTLELALVGAPMVVAYKVDRVAQALGFLVKTELFALANLVVGRMAFPELLQDNCTPAKLAAGLRVLLADTPEREAQRAALAEIRRIMTASGAVPSDAAAAIVLAAAKHSGP